MKIIFHPSFNKPYLKLREKEKTKFKERVAIFLEDEFSPILNNHAIKGKYNGYRSINVTGDLRAIYKGIGDELYLFVDIGTHSRLYS